MSRIYIRWTDEEVLQWAFEMVSSGDKLIELEKRLAVSHSTLHWNFMHRLPELDYQLYEQVICIMDAHKHHRERRSIHD